MPSPTCAFHCAGRPFSATSHNGATGGWGVHPMAQCRLLNYSHRMNEQHYFQSQKTEDSAHLGSAAVSESAWGQQQRVDDRTVRSRTPCRIRTLSSSMDLQRAH